MIRDMGLVGGGGGAELGYDLFENAKYLKIKFSQICALVIFRFSFYLSWSLKAPDYMSLIATFSKKDQDHALSK